MASSMSSSASALPSNGAPSSSSTSQSSSSTYQAVPRTVPKPQGMLDIQLNPFGGFSPTCPECKADDTVVVDDKEGVMVCSRCGAQVGDRIISEESEWRTFEDSKGKDDPSRVGGPESGLIDDPFTTIIGNDASGSNKLGRAHHKVAMKASQRKLLSHFSSISHVCKRMHLPGSISERVKEIFKLLIESDEFKKRRGEDIIAACLFIGCRQGGAPRPIKDICAAVDRPLRDVGRMLTRIKRSDLFKSLKGDKQASFGPKYLRMFAARLAVPPAVTATAEHIAEATKRLGVGAGKNPASIAGAAILLACEQHPGQRKELKEVSDVVGMAASTVKAAYDMLVPMQAQLLPTLGSE